MKNKSNKLINIEEYVHINGINQYMYHSGTNYDNPVLLFLHGGPGNAESLFAYTFQKKWEEIFTVVHYDQRGAGKTLTKNPDKYPTIDLMLEDLYETIQYLKKKYNKERIILLGHSWGSILGSTFIKKYPEEILYYIGVGQVINMLDNERIGYEKLKGLIVQENDVKSLKKLEAIGEYPGNKFDNETLKKCMKLRKLQSKYGLSIDAGFAIVKMAFKSPNFEISDIFSFMKAFKSNKNIIEFMGEYDLKLEAPEYEIPVYYIMGGSDWQTPFILAQEYFNTISAPGKKFYLIPNAGHMTMFDQPDLFFDALVDINSKVNEVLKR